MVKNFWSENIGLVCARLLGISGNIEMHNKLFTQRFKFSNWPNREIPSVAAGVYTVWKNSDLIYCGMSGREIDIKAKASLKKYGMITRLASHASGRLSGDQFCVYVANRFVIPSITAEELLLFESGKLTLDARTKTFIHEHLEYAYALVEKSADAYNLERAARRGELFGMKPHLNPL